MIVKLKRPFKRLDGGTCEAVTLREYMTGGDVLAQRRAHATDEVIQTYALICRMCGLDLAELESMDVQDIRAISDLIGAILQREVSEDPKG